MSSTHLEQIRQAVAENGRQNMETSVPEPEELAVLLQRIADLLNKYVELASPEFGTLISLWIANTAFVKRWYEMFPDDPYIGQMAQNTYFSVHLYAMAARLAGTTEQETVKKARSISSPSRTMANS